MSPTTQVRGVTEVERGRPVEWSVDGGPVLVRGGASDWPLVQACASGDFVAAYGDRELTAVRSSPEAADQARREASPGWTTTLREFLTYCGTAADGEAAEAPWYVKDWTVASETDPGAFLPARLPHSLRSWFTRLPAEARPGWEWIYVGPRGSGSAMHVDVMMSSAWNAVAAGTKHWRFLSPAASVRAGVLPEPYLDLVAGRDDAEFECSQEAGDLLVIPSGWAHQVVNHDTTVAVTGNFVNGGNVEFARRYLRTRGRTAWLKLLDALTHDEREWNHAA
ncbi:cupin-like domain-containing protein [Streptomyces sp. NPDC086549]|uniref:cupin-like domain-containing protein n=1 Tax=Streptomyces sp. NPDC086549 TaxID=3365752 RepID=UPI0038304E4F